MAEPVDRAPEGTPRSPRSGDVDGSAGGALAQARHVFLQGCDLPRAWAGRPHWRILETGFGRGLNFLAAWRAWKDDPQRPGLLHFASVQARPVAAPDLLRSAASHPELQPLAAELAAQWWGLVAGVHRLQFEGGRVLLTLAVGEARAMLQEQAFAADAVFLDGFDAQHNAPMWELPTLKALARLCGRGTGVATCDVAGQVSRDLQQCGFVLEKVPGLPPTRECLRGRFDPAWDVRHPIAAPPVPAGRAVVVGAGLAGAAAAASLARRGWQVQVLDAAAAPAAGASGLPAGLLAPHSSPDDNLLSRLSRAGVRVTLQQAASHLREGADWAPTGVLQQRVGDERPLADLGDEAAPWQQWRDASHRALWHRAGGWIRPAALVQAWLAQPGITWRGNTRVERVQAVGGGWQLLDAAGQQLATADLVVLAAALGTRALADGRLTLHPVRGQVSWNLLQGRAPLAATPVNGNGHFLPSVALPDGAAWLTGSTYGRGEDDLAPRAQDQQANFERLRQLLPAVAGRLQEEFASGAVRAWAGVRCASSDRRPLLGELAPGLWVSTAMGSRGLTFAALCAELLAARLHGEPLPLPARLAAALDANRSRDRP